MYKIYKVKPGCENLTRYTAKGATKLSAMSQKDVAAWETESPNEVAQYFDIAEAEAEAKADKDKK